MPYIVREKAPLNLGQGILFNRNIYFKVYQLPMTVESKYANYCFNDVMFSCYYRFVDRRRGETEEGQLLGVEVRVLVPSLLSHYEHCIFLILIKYVHRPRSRKETDIFKNEERK